MSRFYSDAYKWSLYEKYRNGFTLTELCEMSGVTDKPLRQAVRQKQAELKLLSEIMAVIPEAQRVSYAYPLLEIYGTN